MSANKLNMNREVSGGELTQNGMHSSIVLGKGRVDLVAPTQIVGGEKNSVELRPDPNSLRRAFAEVAARPKGQPAPGRRPGNRIELKPKIAPNARAAAFAKMRQHGLKSSMALLKKVDQKAAARPMLQGAPRNFQRRFDYKALKDLHGAPVNANTTRQVPLTSLRNTMAMFESLKNNMPEPRPGVSRRPDLYKALQLISKAGPVPVATRALAMAATRAVVAMRPGQPMPRRRSPALQLGL